MSQTVDELEAIKSIKTLSPVPDADDDGSLPRELPEQRECPRLIISATSIARLVAPAAGNACANDHAQLPARDARVLSRQFKIGCTGNGHPRSDVPYLRMRGRWLERAGFAIGQRVKVDVDQRRLIIEPVD